MKVSLVGTGNVAWHLAKLLRRQGHRILQIGARNPDKAPDLKEIAAAPMVPLSTARFTREDVVLVCVSDRALTGAWQLNTGPDVIVAHTAGVVPARYAGSPHGHHAAFYPFTSFTRGQPLTHPRFPIFVTAPSPAIRERLMALGKSLTGIAFEAGDAERARLHLAGVFVNNFVNFLLKIGFSMPPSRWNTETIFRPILTETLEKALRMGPEKAQTGPAARGDLPTLAAHLQMLKNHPEWQTVYRLLSDLIRQQYPSDRGT